MQKYVHIVDLVNSFFLTSFLLLLQKSASIQPRASLSRFGGIQFILLVHSLQGPRGREPRDRGCGRDGRFANAAPRSSVRHPWDVYRKSSARLGTRDRSLDGLNSLGTHLRISVPSRHVPVSLFTLFPFRHCMGCADRQCA